ncbi:MSC_0623 family F1-like ATPase-associated protein [Metamycoplasma auris]|uniref:Uncharacterized protein DUF2714 n=1 Tax=Metamycoplasma auris TaxID=51363 RepID=A0A2W7G5D3_9BACT|nr:DUF2714 domain-containing protein [Metamycoplasma auris]PZW01477.1 uncharacterized protein DUF2714 [Metamycoplasma auris]
MNKKNKLEKKLLMEANKEIKTLSLVWNEIQNQTNFISFQKLFFTVLLKSNLKTNDKDVLFFLNKIKEAIAKKYDLVFDRFVISFNLVNKFNNLYICPYIANSEATNFESLNLTSNSTLFNSNLIMNLNREINYLLDNDFYVEVIEDLVIKKNEDIELFYDKKSILGW